MDSEDDRLAVGEGFGIGGGGVDETVKNNVGDSEVLGKLVLLGKICITLDIVLDSFVVLILAVVMLIETDIDLLLILAFSIGLTPLPVFGLGDLNRNTGTIVPTINPIMSATANPRTMPNIRVLLEQRHFPRGLTFSKLSSSSSTSSSKVVRRGMPSLYTIVETLNVERDPIRDPCTYPYLLLRASP